MLTRQKVVNTLHAIEFNCVKNNWDKAGAIEVAISAINAAYLFLLNGRQYEEHETVHFIFDGGNYLVTHMYPGVNGEVIFEALDVLTNKQFEVYCYSPRELIFFNVTEEGRDNGDLGNGMA